jgi:hypothetical protein
MSFMPPVTIVLTCILRPIEMWACCRIQNKGFYSNLLHIYNVMQMHIFNGNHF